MLLGKNESQEAVRICCPPAPLGISLRGWAVIVDAKQGSQRLLAVSANSVWNLLNFRLGLLQALIRQGYSLSALVPPSQATSELEKAGIAAHAIPMSPRGISPLSDSRLLFAYLSVIEELAPAALLSFTAKPNIYGSIAARLRGVPVIANITGLGTGFLSGKALELVQSGLYRLALAAAPQVFFHNPDDRALFLRRRLVRADQATVIPGSGIDLDRFEFRSPPRNPEPVFLFIGRLLKDKGIVEFVEAARLVKEDSPAIRFQVLGGVEQHPKAVPAEMLRQWEKDGVVEFLGSAEDVRPLITEADCVVLPSYREGLPRVLLEASAMGRAVIGTNVPGCRHAIEDGVTGFLCEPQSASSLAETMANFARLSTDQRRLMGERAREKAEREFGEERVIEAYISALDRILGPRATSPGMAA
jgi:glycosyltransferase involved in cell wall biosynthesis